MEFKEFFGIIYQQARFRYIAAGDRKGSSPVALTVIVDMGNVCPGENRWSDKEMRNPFF